MPLPGKMSLMTTLATLHVRLFTWRRGEPVGEDRSGNRYFKERRPPPDRRERRWVLYNGEPEATRVPPEWFGWLHHNADAPLPDDSRFHKPWVKEHQPNLSGTTKAYRPPGHTFQGGQRAAATGDYEPWTPS